MGRTMARDTLLCRLAPLLLAAAGCGRDARPAEADPWPLALSAPGVISYAAVRLDDGARDGLAESLLGFAPAGLDASRPLVELHLDSKAYGGSYSLLLPLRDGDAFIASLDAAPGLRHLGRGEYVFEITPDSELGRMALLASGLRGTHSLSGILSTLEHAGPQSVAFRVQVEDDLALVGSTFEALSVCRDVLRQTDAFAQAPPRDVVLSLDLERLRTVYAEDLRNLEDQLKGLIGGAQTAGLLGMAARMGDDHEQGPALDLGVNWEIVWALKDMLGLSRLEALQVQVVTLPAPSGPDDTLMDRLESVHGGSLRVRAAPDAPLAALAATLRPAPDLRDATLVFAADGPAFARAVAEWMRPLGEVVKGKGAPCDRYLDELASILSVAGGTFALLEVDGEPCLLASAGSAQSDLLPRLSAWLAPLLAAAHIGSDGGGVTTRELGDGRTLLLDAEGAPHATIGRRGDAFWLRGGEADEPTAAVTAFEQALSAPVPDGSPSLRVHTSIGRAELRSDDRELVLELHRVDDDGR